MLEALDKGLADKEEIKTWAAAGDWLNAITERAMDDEGFCFPFQAVQSQSKKNEAAFNSMCITLLERVR